MRFVAWLSMVVGVLLPAAETWRRWGERVSGRLYWPSMLDDWLVGMFLLAGAMVWRRNRVLGRRVLIGAWGCAVGMGYMSFFGHVREWGVVDPSGVGPRIVTGLIGVGWSLAVVALGMCIAARTDG